MKIQVRVKPNCRQNEVTKVDETTYLVRVTAPPVEGKANEKLIDVLAEYFDKPTRCISIVRGSAARVKIVEIE